MRKRRNHDAGFKARVRAFFKSVPVLVRSELRLAGREEAADRLLQALEVSNRTPSGTRVPPPGSRLTVRKGVSIMRKRPRRAARAGRRDLVADLIARAPEGA